jgi:valyl-tRNA synthetase
VGRHIPVVADDYSDPEKGSGAVKITPAHDFNDFEVGKRHNLEQINIFTPDARMNENVPETFRGLDRFEARRQVINQMEALGLLEKVEETAITLPHGERSNVIIEPYLTDQWFVKTEEMAAAALKAVADQKTEILPASSRAVYEHWLNHIQPWCISRQLWWGHRIPAWYAPDNSIIVAETEDEAYQLARVQFGDEVVIRQEDDVLDTWFSSGLWPFSTLGWPELAKYYPSSVLITGSDIIFFWVVRMMMLSLKFMDDVPFKTVYLHALVRDEKGQKMSKSKGNILNPLDLVDAYGADALRFTMAALAAPGRDIRFSKQLVEGYRNFATKLWNAVRFLEHYGCSYPEAFDPQTLKVASNRWIVSELSNLMSGLEQALDSYSFDDAAHMLYQFIWGRFCDWYLEIIKPILSGDEGTEKAETSATVAWVLGTLCHLLHPFMPFITEEIWQHLAPAQGSLITAAWPNLKGWQDTTAKEDISWVIEVVTTIRGLRNELNIPPSTPLDLQFAEGQSHHQALLQAYTPMLEKLARLSKIMSEPATEIPKGTAQLVVDGSTLLIPLGDILDLDTERQRLEKALTEATKEITQMQVKLSNAEFTAKAPAEIIEKNQARLAEAMDAKEKLSKALARIG